MIYLDNSATTRPFKFITDNLGNFAYENFANPSSLYIKGVEVEQIINNARSIIANSLNVSSNEIFFTSGGTESNNISIRGFVNANKRNIGTIVTTKIEHPSVLNVFESLREEGFDVEYLNVDNKGVVDFEQFENLLKSKNISFVSIMHINNEIGTMQPLDKIIDLKKKYGFVLHIDAVQSYAKFNFSKFTKYIDLLSASGHKIHALKGVGFLYIKNGTKVNSIVKGGGQERQIRSGTENVVGIWSIGEAVKYFYKDFDNIVFNMRENKKYFVNRVLNEIKTARLNGPIDDDISSPYIANISFEKIPGEVMLHSLESKDVYVSTGSACSSKKKGISHVLKSIGISEDVAKSAVRFSICAETTREELDKTVEFIKEICNNWG